MPEKLREDFHIQLGPSAPYVYAETAECQACEHQFYVAAEVVTTRRVDNIPHRLVVQEAEHKLGGKQHVHGD